MNMNVPAVIQDTSRGAMKHSPIDGMVDSTMLLPSQRQAVDGLIKDTSTRAGMSERAPIRAEGSYVGAPSMPKGHAVKAFAPATRTVKGRRMPVGQN
jgi:hypothetical protein